MAYEIARGESLEHAVRRVVLEQIDEADRGLRISGRRALLDDSIHEARKCFKRIRSALRLVRRALPGKRFRRENVRFRELGRMLSAPRESHVAVLTIDALASRFESVLKAGSFAEVRAHFMERHLVALWRTEADGSLAEVIDGLAAARCKAARLPFSGTELIWLPEVLRAYEEGTRWMATAEVSRSPEAYHEWRKEAKHLRYHLRLLRPAWSGRLDAAETHLHKLTDVLGEHHDLTDLDWQLGGDPSVLTTTVRRGEATALDALVIGRRHQLETEARDLGVRIYSRDPDELAERLRSLWLGWRSTQTVE
ncbi:MAG TPA: CHAD domain-containing protein [Vicinamibacteria bacterium]|jgi:CHAD domain-containing protein